MVKNRDGGKDSTAWKINWENYLDRFGTTVTLNHFTETYDTMGRMLTKGATISTIKADIQWASKSNIEHLNVGDIQIGDGMLFCKTDVTISVEDEIVYNGYTWRVVEQIEGEQVGGETVYLGFVIRKNASPEEYSPD